MKNGNDRREALSVSRLTCWTACQRKHLFAYDYGVRRIVTGDALAFGTAWHKALETYYNLRLQVLDKGYARAWIAGEMLRAATATADAWDGYVIARLSASIMAYFELFFSGDLIAQMRPELEFAYPIEGSRTFAAVGKIDGLATLNDGRIALVEHKTTSDSIAPDSGYWARLRYNPQLCRYVLGARALGIKCETIIYDVLHKPAMKPLAEVKDVDEDGAPIVLDAQGARVIKRDGTPKRTADAAKGERYQTHGETADEYETRLYADMLDRPDFYFGRREVTVTDEMLDAFRLQERMTARQILATRAEGRAIRKRGLPYEAAFARNVGRATCEYCDYADYCLSGQTISSDAPPPGFAVTGATPELSAR